MSARIKITMRSMTASGGLDGAAILTGARAAGRIVVASEDN